MSARKPLHHASIATFVAVLFVSSASLANGPDLPPLQSYGGQFTQVVPRELVPSNEILTLDGSIVRMSQFRGGALIVNFWATWCAACIYELPALERLAARYRSENVTVMEISIDQGGVLDVLPFLKKYGLAGSDVYLDPEQNLGSRFVRSKNTGAMPLFGLPMTYFIDRDGYVLGYISGAVDWDSPDARDFVDHLEASGGK